MLQIDFYCHALLDLSAFLFNNCRRRSRCNCHAKRDERKRREQEINKNKKTKNNNYLTHTPACRSRHNGTTCIYKSVLLSLSLSLFYTLPYALCLCVSFYLDKGIAQKKPKLRKTMCKKKKKRIKRHDTFLSSTFCCYFYSFAFYDFLTLVTHFSQLVSICCCCCFNKNIT